MDFKTISNPANLKDKGEIADIITYLEEFEHLNGAEGVIVERQSLSLGACYDVIDKRIAERDLQKWHGREIYLRFWPKAYFLQLLNPQ